MQSVGENSNPDGTRSVNQRSLSLWRKNSVSSVGSVKDKKPPTLCIRTLEPSVPTDNHTHIALKGTHFSSNRGELLQPPNRMFTDIKPRRGDRVIVSIVPTDIKKESLFIRINSLEKRRRPTLPRCNAVPSARVGLTSLFGMGRGGTPLL